MPGQSFFITAVATLTLVGLGAEAQGQAGTTLTPDRQGFMVNKDIDEERWTITLTLAQTEPPVITSITGNVFRRDGGPPAFVACQVRPDSTGSLSNPSSVFRLDCKGTDACPGNARECARTSWRPLAEDLRIGADFFLPPEGLGTAAGSSKAATPRSVMPGGAPRAAAETPAQSAPRGATLTFDGLNFLVNKDIGTERWSISVNLVPARTSSGGARDRLLSITGNVFQADGSPPAFVYCLPTESSEGTLDDPSSLFRLACEGTSTCSTSALNCAETSWVDLGEVTLNAGFFLPPEGLPASVQSDPELFVIGRTSDPPAIAVPNFSTPASLGPAGPLGLGCAEGSPCVVDQVGGCENVTGEQVLLGDGRCACLLDEIPPSCIACGSSASGSCGGTCAFEVGGATARGNCLPFAATSADCVCYANDAAGRSATESCAGVLDATCPTERCCADDPRDGCSLAGGDFDCAGVCVVDDCDDNESCGICGLAVCGDGVASGTEACDGTDLRGRSCRSLGFAGGTLTCTAACTFDEDRCFTCLADGQFCQTNSQCCSGTCFEEQCSAGATPTPTPRPTPSPTPKPTPPPASPTPTAPLPCQSRPGGPCLGEGFGDCCTPDLSCILGPGVPPRMVCSQTIPVCGNRIVEPGEQCERDADCANLGSFSRCDDCECVPSDFGP